MLEQPSFDPGLRIGAVDPTLQGGSTQFTLAECPPETTATLEAYMGARHGNADMRLEQDTSLAEQCNANYASLNERGITMPQYVSILETAEATAEAMNSGQNGVQRILRHGDTRIRQEIVGHRESLGGERHPLTGELIPSTTNTFAIEPPADFATDHEEEMGMWDGFSDVEVEMAQLGVFTARRGYESATCRADEILDRLAATQTGQRIMNQHGIVVAEGRAEGRQRPETPIALVSEQQPVTETDDAGLHRAEAVAVPQQPEAVQRRRLLGRIGIGRKDQ